jgi:hypothetical protein
MISASFCLGETIMHLTQESTQEIQDIMSGMDCPFDFQCYKSGFKELCGELLEDSGKLVDCVNEKSAECKFSVFLSSGFLCACPLRIYIATNYKK